MNNNLSRLNSCT